MRSDARKKAADALAESIRNLESGDACAVGPDIAAAKAEALREAADEFPGPHSRKEVNNSRDARRWLRDRADKIEGA